MKYDDPENGEWIFPIMKGYKACCCDCGLVHRMEFRVCEDDKDRIENRSEFVLVDEISEWCKTNDIKYRTIMSWDYDNPDLRHPMITFNTIEDAMAFKLQWS